MRKTINGWQGISWEEAFNEVGRHLKEIQEIKPSPEYLLKSVESVLYLYNHLDLHRNTGRQ